MRKAAISAHLNQSDIYDLIEATDRLPGLMAARLGRWRAWSVAKPAIYGALLGQMIEDGEPRPGRRRERLWRGAMAAVREAPRLLNASSHPAIVLLTVPRIHRFPDGQERDAIYDELPAQPGLPFAPLILDYIWALNDHATRRAGRYGLRPATDVAAALSRLVERLPRVRRASQAIAEVLARSELPGILPDHGARVSRALAAFDARRLVFRRLFQRLHARAVVLTDSPFKCGEAAAAKELGLPVIELQHGMFGPRCPEYGWPQEFAAYKHEMPLPDRLLVFGELWRDLALQGGFWTAAETPIAGAGAIDRYRTLSAGTDRRDERLRLAFMTQDTNRRFSLDFWREFLAASMDRPIEVVIKVHPGEARAMPAYQSLAEHDRARCRIAAPDANPFDVIKDSDMVMSCNSYSLAEAIALGRPTISLCGGDVPEGFAGTFALPGFRRVMPHVRSVAELLAVIDAAARGSPALEDWQSRTERQGRKLYATGFLAQATAIIREFSDGAVRRGALHSG